MIHTKEKHGMMERDELRLLAQMLTAELERQHSAELAPKWQYGTVIFKPSEPGLKQHEISMERFMHKVVMMRDNLRVLEQQVNANKNLELGEKIKLQGYITKIYGSMTSFNFMFANEDDTFVGSTSDK
jgi:hypothetical protein